MERLERGPVIVVLAVAALVVAAAGARYLGPRVAAGPRPNVLVILWDTVRADRMSLYGHSRPTTPNLDRWAREARVYERAYSPGMWTVPSHGSLFTGLPAASHGARVGWLWLDDHHTTLAEWLGASGYRTFAWSSNPYVSDQTNLLQGFGAVRYSWRGEEAARSAQATHAKLLAEDRSVEIAPGWERPAGHAGDGWPEHLTAYKDAGPVIGESFLGWVDEADGKPFFAYLNFLEAHHPRVPSAEARAAVAEPATVARALATDTSLFRIMAAMEGKASFTPEELEAIAATYDATLWDLDRATAAILDGLEARGILDDTIVVITSDHGENLGERGLFDHRWDLHQTLVHVPLVIRYPRAVAAGAEPAPVSTAHLYGTLAALTGVPAPDLGYPLPELGASPAVFSELEAPTPRLPEIRAAFPDLRPDRWQVRFQAIFERPWKLLRATDGRSELYDLDADPGEQQNRVTDRSEVAGSLREALIRWDRERPKYDPSRRSGGDRPGNPLKVDPSLRDQLRQLGYTEEEEAP